MYDVVVIGAGPYGLSVAAHLIAAGTRTKIFGRVMESWRDHMPEGMFLKSEPWASNLSDPAGARTLARYGAEAGFPTEHGHPLPIGAFTDYGLWFARHAVPELDERTVTRVAAAGEGFTVGTADGDTVRTRTVVVAVGVLPFVRIPGPLARLPKEYVTHSTGHRDLTRFRDRDVIVVGAGQAALETATLLAETGARPTLVARADRVNWNTVPLPEDRPVARRLRTPLSGLGSGWRSWIYSELPWAVRRLPDPRREHIARTALGPAGAWWLRERYEGALPELLAHRVRGATLHHGRIRITLDAPEGPATLTTDHVVAATGFVPDLDRLPLLDPALRTRLTTLGTGGSPELTPLFESSCPGLFFTGLLSAPAFGPSMRFVHGATYTARHVTRGVHRHLRPRPAAIPRPPAPATHREPVRKG
ncbi:NAD(P)-binding domain-containing protein [Streptomyces sp. NPDC058953]|uniref:NAD(P)-binding domain-containing protein n=1 Tax=unclassified Streptomyces TaxID=2593676 RepID=UPI0036C9F7FF